jgi:uncharacterized phage-like protein YoqJ
LTVCTFAGHREVFSSSIEVDIDHALSEIIQTDNDFIFYSGGMGDFDKRCESTVRRMKSKYPEQKIRLVLVLPYLTHEINRDKEYFEFCYDDIVVPMELMGVHYKAAIKKRNRWMVDRADKILAYIYRDFGGAFDTVKYAYRTGKLVLNLAPKG